MSAAILLHPKASRAHALPACPIEASVSSGMPIAVRNAASSAAGSGSATQPQPLSARPPQGVALLASTGVAQASASGTVRAKFSLSDGNAKTRALAISRSL